MELMDDSRIYASRRLMDKVKKKCPETARMTYTALVTWALEKVLQGVN